MAQLFAIMDEGGQTLVSRSLGNLQAPSFPALGLLFSIATYSEASGFEMQSFSTQDVRIVYKRFNSLLFILATNNLLIQADALKGMLQASYEGLLLLLGAKLLAADNAFELDRLRKALRGCTAFDYLVSTDTMLPSILLPGPQELCLCALDRTSLEHALGQAADAADTQQAALLGSGLYLATTPGWQQMTSRELCLLQLVAAHSVLEAGQASCQVYLAEGKHLQSSSLVVCKVSKGVQLVFLYPSKAVSASQPLMDSSSIKLVKGACEAHLHSTSAQDGLSGLPFDAALLCQMPKVTLIWGRLQGNPFDHGTGGQEGGTRYPAAGMGVSANVQAALTAFMLRCMPQDDTAEVYKRGQEDSPGSAGEGASGRQGSRGTNGQQGTQGPPSQTREAAGQQHTGHAGEGTAGQQQAGHAGQPPRLDKRPSAAARLLHSFGSKGSRKHDARSEDVPSPSQPASSRAGEAESAKGHEEQGWAAMREQVVCGGKRMVAVEYSKSPGAIVYLSMDASLSLSDAISMGWQLHMGAQ